jgi:phosphoribosylformimino-5-aminoimidazole carboxamide ribotide isomerase
MKVIPVLDIRHGRAVHAVAGDRDHYGPLRSILHGGPDPIALARAGRDAWGLGDLYVADLDAILGESPPEFSLYRAFHELGLDLWVDAGVRDAGDLPGLLGAGVGRVVAGLETVGGPEALAGIVDEAGADRVAFSLDLREGRPMVDTIPRWGTSDPDELALRAVASGVRRIIRLDLARVGTGRGAGSDAPGRITVEGGGPLEWFVGGGIAGIGEIRTLSRAGFDGVLVGSALHDGRIGAGDLEALRAPPLASRDGLLAHRPSDQLTIRTSPGPSSK